MSSAERLHVWKRGQAELAKEGLIRPWLRDLAELFGASAISGSDKKFRKQV